MSDTPANAETHDKPHAHGGGHGAHGGGHEEGHEGAPEWLISFADMVMLMMGFFVILFALNNNPSGRQPGGNAPDQSGGAEKPKEDMLDFAIAVREAFNNPVNVQSTDPRDAPLIARLRQRAGKGEAHDQGVEGKEQDVQSIRPSDYRALSGSVPFAEHSAELLDSSKTTIAQIARKVRGLRLIVEVRGHVSSVEAARGPENAMKLSADRAQIVARALAAEGVAWWQLRLVVCADHDRLEAHPNNRAADKANARVEVILTDEVVPDEVPTRYDDSGATAAWTPGGGPLTASP